MRNRALDFFAPLRSLLVIVLFSLMGCSSPSTVDNFAPAVLFVRGEVVDEEGEVVAGAEIAAEAYRFECGVEDEIVGGETAMSDQRGRFDIEVEIPPFEAEVEGCLEIIVDGPTESGLTTSVLVIDPAVFRSPVWQTPPDTVDIRVVLEAS